MLTELDRIVGTAAVGTPGRRAGRDRSNDRLIDLDLRPPTEMGGPCGATHPERFSAAGYAACFQGALGVVGCGERTDASGSLVTCHGSRAQVGDVYGLASELEVAISGVDAETSERLAQEAHRACPCSNATRENIGVEAVARLAAGE